jgi:hypothetical protein
MWRDKEKPKLSTAKLTLDHDQAGYVTSNGRAPRIHYPMIVRDEWPGDAEIVYIKEM